VHSVREEMRRASRVEGVARKMTGTVKYRAGSSQEGLDGVQAVAGTVGSFGRMGWWTAGQNSL